MSEFTFWVIGIAASGFFLSWLMFWVQYNSLATMLGIFSAVAMGALVIMGLDEGRRNGGLQTGDLGMMIAIGAGLTWGVMIVRL